MDATNHKYKCFVSVLAQRLTYVVAVARGANAAIQAYIRTPPQANFDPISG